MTNPKAPPRTAAEINQRLGEIGAELAKGRITPVPNARALEAEQEALKVKYLEALNGEGAAKRDAVEIAARVEAARQVKLAKEREARIEKAVVEATR
jgi:hypothetical protein